MRVYVLVYCKSINVPSTTAKKCPNHEQREEIISDWLFFFGVTAKANEQHEC